MPSQPSRQAPGEPGRQKMYVAPATPAVARLWIVDVPILAWLSMWNAIEKPSMRFSNRGSTASGVTSRPVKPVPPVVMMASTPASAIQRRITARIASTSSVTISRAASLWPADVSRSASVAPDLSSASARVSDIVSTAMLSGMNCLFSSIDIVLSRVPDAVQRETLLRRAGTPEESRQVEAWTPDQRRTASRCAASGERRLQRARAKRITRLHRALLIAGHEPLLALRGGAVGETVGHHPARRLALQRVVADCGRRLQRSVDIAGLEEARPL